MKDGKIWGVTEEVFVNNNVELHKIEVKPGGYCSKHFHRYKHNFFLVLEGNLDISVWKDYGLVDKTHLYAGDKMSVPPGQYHQFSSTSGCVAIEVYYVTLDGADIIRENTGGCNETKQRVLRQARPEVHAKRGGDRCPSI